MKSILIIAFISIWIISCSKQIIPSISNVEKDFDIFLLNDTLIVPSNDKNKLIDTLKFKLINNSAFNYIFAMPDTSVYLSNTDSKYTDEIWADPNDGVLLRFLDKNNKTIETKMYSGFTGDNFTDLVEKDIIFIKKGSSFMYKVILKYPIKNIWGSLSYTIKNIHKTKYIDVFIDFNNLTTNMYFDKFRYGLKANEKILDKKFIFRRPVKIIN